MNASLSCILKFRLLGMYCINTSTQIMLAPTMQATFCCQSQLSTAVEGKHTNTAHDRHDPPPSIIVELHDCNMLFAKNARPRCKSPSWPQPPNLYW